MRRATYILASMVTAVLLATGLAMAETPSGTRDAYFEVPPGPVPSFVTPTTYRGNFYLGDEFEVAQQFTANNSGKLTSAQAELYDVEPGSELTMEIAALDGSGNPSTVLASTTIPDSSIPDHAGRTIITGSFSTPASVTALTKYALVLKLTGSGRYEASPGGWIYFADFRGSDPYPGGEVLTRGWWNNFAYWQHDNWIDVGFATYLNGEVSNGDSTPPVLSLPGAGDTKTITAEATSSSGAVVTFSATAEDDVDGTVPVTCVSVDPADLESGATFPIGTTEVKCSATDAAGNKVEGSFFVKVTYAWSGLLQPTNGGLYDSLNAYDDDDSIFKLGSTVPLKFKLSGESAGITDATAKVYVSKVSNSIAGDEAEATSTSSADTGNTFRYDATNAQYIYNLSTKGTTWTDGTYQARIDLGDGTTNTVRFSLKK